MVQHRHNAFFCAFCCAFCIFCILHRFLSFLRQNLNGLISFSELQFVRYLDQVIKVASLPFFFFLSIFLCVYSPVFLFLCLSVYLCFFVCLLLSLSMNCTLLFVSVFLSLCLCFCLSISFYLFLCPSVFYLLLILSFLSFYLCFTIPLSISSIQWLEFVHFSNLILILKSFQSQKLFK